MQRGGLSGTRFEGACSSVLPVQLGTRQVLLLVGNGAGPEGFIHPQAFLAEVAAVFMPMAHGLVRSAAERLGDRSGRVRPAVGLIPLSSLLSEGLSGLSGPVSNATHIRTDLLGVVAGVTIIAAGLTNIFKDHLGVVLGRVKPAAGFMNVSQNLLGVVLGRMELAASAIHLAPYRLGVTQGCATVQGMGVERMAPSTRWHTGSTRSPKGASAL